MSDIQVEVTDLKGRNYIVDEVTTDFTPDGQQRVLVTIGGIRAELLQEDHAGEQTLFEASGLPEPEYVHRDAVSGKFVTEEYATKNPDTTVRERADG